MKRTGRACPDGRRLLPSRSLPESAAVACCLSLLLAFSPVSYAQAGKQTGKAREPFEEPDLGERFSPRLGMLVPNIDDAEGEIKVIEGRSRLLRTHAPVFRTHIADPQIADVVQFEPRQLALLGQRPGATTMTLWFEGEPRPLTVQVRVIRDPELEQMRERDYSMLEAQLNEMFPNSNIRLVPIADKVVLMGQAKNAEEAAHILSIVTANGGWGAGNVADANWADWAGGGALVAGAAAQPFGGQNQIAGSMLINMLQVPGEHTVMLKVIVAELNRSAMRSIGTDLENIDISLSDDVRLFLSSIFAAEGNAQFSIDTNDVDVDAVIRFLASNGTLKVLAQGTVTTLSGRWGSFLAGSEFAVPTALGLAGGQTTSFRGVGFNLDFLPLVVDKDLIRLTLVPEFSQPNSNLAVGGVPGVDTRALFTTVELREGQTYAVATLVQDTTENENTRIPFLGDLPWVGTLFSVRYSTHNEQELVILVTPELVSPMEPDEVPPLPGYDVTEPTDKEFYFSGRTEGRPGSHWRSTIWPINWTRIRDYFEQESRYVAGPAGHVPPSPYGGPIVEGTELPAPEQLLMSEAGGQAVPYTRPQPYAAPSMQYQGPMGDVGMPPGTPGMQPGPMVAPPPAAMPNQGHWSPPTGTSWQRFRFGPRSYQSYARPTAQQGQPSGAAATTPVARRWSPWSWRR